MLQKLKEIDEWVIRILTGVVWWVDVHYNKNNVWCARMSFLFLPQIYFFIEVFFFEDGNDKKTTEFTLSILLLSVLLQTVLMMVWVLLFEVEDFGKIYIRQATEVPNPNRLEPTIILLKVSSLILWFCAIIRYQSLFHTSVFLSFTASFFFLCTNNIPPKEKQKEREKNETKKMFLE